MTKLEALQAVLYIERMFGTPEGVEDLERRIAEIKQ